MSHQSSLKLAVKVAIKSLTNMPCSKLMHVFKSLVNLQEETFQHFFQLKVWRGWRGAAVSHLNNDAM